jgi:hypothetical protein
MWNKIKNLFKDYKDIIIEDQKQTIKRLQKENAQKQNEIFALYDLIEALKQRISLVKVNNG